MNELSKNEILYLSGLAITTSIVVTHSTHVHIQERMKRKQIQALRKLHDDVMTNMKKENVSFKVKNEFALSVLDALQKI